MCAQNRAVVNLFRGPNLIEDVATTMRRLEEGDLKLRVRALDSERALTRVLVRGCSLPWSSFVLVGRCVECVWPVFWLLVTVSVDGGPLQLP